MSLGDVSFSYSSESAQLSCGHSCHLGERTKLCCEPFMLVHWKRSEVSRRLGTLTEPCSSLRPGLFCQIMTFANAGRLPQKPPRRLLKNWIALRGKLRASAGRRNFIRYEVRQLWIL
jgi:hypothetical protein